MFKTRAARYPVLLLALALILAACSGGGGSSNGGGNNTQLSALVVASNVSVLSAQTTTVAGKPGPQALLLGVTSLPPATDYYNDKAEVWVADRTTDSFDTINTILCMMGQTRYDAMLNKGVFKALVDANMCSTSNSDPSAAGQQAQNQSSGADMPNYWTFTVDSTRADNSSPEYVSMWIRSSGSKPGGSQDNPMYIFGKATITEGASSTNPYGIFTFDFTAYDMDANGQPTGAGNSLGTLSAQRNGSGKVILNFVQNDGHPDCNGFQRTLWQITLDRQPDGSAGAGKIYTSGTGSCGSQVDGFNFAYDANDFYRIDSAATYSTCLNRTQFDESSWSYGLYDATGARVNRNAGFPITGDDGNAYFKAANQGWIGYWGLSTNGTTTIDTGDTVNKVDYRTNTSTPYTVLKAGGKLTRHTRKYLSLGDIKNIPLNYWEQLESCATGTQYQVVFDGTNFIKTAQMPQNCGGNCTWQSITPQAVDLTALMQGSLNFWSPSLSGQVQVALISQSTSTCTQNADNSCSTCRASYRLPTSGDPNYAQSVIFYAEQAVNPGDVGVPPTLACYDSCPLYSAFTTTNPFYSWISSPTSTNYNAYAIDTSPTSTASMVLLDHGNPVVASTSLSGNFQWGITSGPLFDPSASNMTALACPWDSTQICSWQAWSVLPEFYTWETGPNSWNQFIGLKDSNNAFVVFDAPLEVQYVHHEAGSPFDGTTFLLEYAGFGQLSGIPSYCVDMDTGATVDCSQSNGSNAIRWVPQFTIPALQADGSLTQVTDGSSAYYVKPLEIEQRMKAESDAGICSTLAGTDFSSYTLPDLGILSTDPFFTNTVTNDPEPTAPIAPAVIGGVVQ